MNEGAFAMLDCLLERGCASHPDRVKALAS
jgi:hypothetical protein